MSDLHDCPIEGCTKRIASRFLMCPRHWRRVPRELAARVYSTYDNGRGLFTEAYAEARDAAIAEVETSPLR